MADILIAEDDPHIRESLTDLLESECHTVRAVKDGAAALEAFALKRPELVMLDVMMPKKSGYDVCREIRKADAFVPILMLTAKSEENDKVLGLGLGADDYITKPFGIRELLARVAAALRRGHALLAAGQESPGVPPKASRINEAAVFSFGACRVDTRRYVLIGTKGRETGLTKRELAALRCFAARPEEVVAREFLLETLWEEGTAVTTRSVDQLILQLRKKLGPDAVRIETISGVGYRFRSARD